MNWEAAKESVTLPLLVVMDEPWSTIVMVPKAALLVVATVLLTATLPIETEEQAVAQVMELPVNAAAAALVAK